MSSALFDFIARHQGSLPWGRVLDAGTGVQSSRWLCGLPTESVTLVTASAEHAQQVRAQASLRPQDRLLVGDWTDPTFLAGEKFDTVLADYLLGAVDGFAPYGQQAVLGRLLEATEAALYVAGLEPYVFGAPPTEAGRLVAEIGRYRDACLLLCGEAPYREYPAQWIIDEVTRRSGRITAARRFPIRYKAPFVESQLRMAAMRITALPDRQLASALLKEGERLRAAALDLIAAEGALAHGHDYIVAWSPRAERARIAPAAASG